MKHKPGGWFVMGAVALLLSWTVRAAAMSWNEAEFAAHRLVAAPLPSGRDGLIGTPTSFTITKGDTLLDIGRWYGLSAREISDANGHLDWWAPPAGRDLILPTERILPEGPRVGIVMNIPEMRIYYFYPPTVVRRRGRHLAATFSGGSARVVYTFPVGLGRFDWKTPVGAWRVTGKLVNPTWVLPKDIYEEHLERDGEADHVIPGGAPDNPLGHYKLVLSLSEYGIHGTDVPWGVGMNVSHGCIRLYPENIEQLYGMTPVGTPGRFVYQPIKFGWRGDRLYVEVHDDLYGVYPGLWNHALHEVTRLRLGSSVDMQKLQAAVEAKSGLPVDVSPGETPALGAETAGATTMPSSPVVTTNPPPGNTESEDSVTSAPDAAGDDTIGVEGDTTPPAAVAHSHSHDSNWLPLPTHITNDNSVE
jgi:L,D-transpeptidase ErfK/SrfK